MAKSAEAVKAKHGAGAAKKPKAARSTPAVKTATGAGKKAGKKTTKKVAAKKVAAKSPAASGWVSSQQTMKGTGNEPRRWLPKRGTIKREEIRRAVRAVIEARL